MKIRTKIRAKIRCAQRSTTTTGSYNYNQGSTGAFAKTVVSASARSVYDSAIDIDIPAPASRSDFEWYAQADFAGCASAVFPAGAPAVVQTVVIQ